MPLDAKQSIYLFFYLDLSSWHSPDDYPAIFASRRGLQRSLILNIILFSYKQRYVSSKTQQTFNISNILGNILVCSLEIIKINTNKLLYMSKARPHTNHVDFKPTLYICIETYYRKSLMPSYFRIFWKEASLSCYRKPI